MLIYLLILAALCLYGIRLSKEQTDYMSIEQTNSIKGICAALIMVSHMRQYLTAYLPGDTVAQLCVGIAGQFTVAVFFFYSAYGVMYSLQNKSSYEAGFLRKRVFHIWLRFAFAVLCYLILSLALGTTYSASDYLLCWIGWSSLGNSNWFAFVILALYLLTWGTLVATRKLTGKRKHLTVATLLTVFSLGLWVCLHLCGKEAYWYNTLLCYALGIWFALKKESFDRFASKWYFRAGLWAVLGVTFLLCDRNDPAGYSLCALAVCLMVALFTKNIHVGNKALAWLGKHAFSIYLYQRIPMILLEKLGFGDKILLFIPLATAGTVLLAFVADRIFDRLLAKKTSLSSGRSNL